MIQKLNAASVARNTASSIITWAWVKKLLHWLIISAGTISECAFLVASLWMSVNASVHALVLLAVDEQTTQHITELATAAYVALPELILGLAVVTTIGHVRIWLYNKRNYTAAIWVGLYGLPTLVFLVLSLITLGCSVTSVNFRLPVGLVVVRALAGYMFAFTSLLYTQLGVPQERDRLAKKDGMLAELRQENAVNLSSLRQEKDTFIETLRQEKDGMLAELRGETARLNDLISQQKAELQKQNELLEESKQHQTELLKAVNKSSDSALQAYSEECINWLRSGIKTVSLDEISRYTGHSKRKLANAITAGNLQTAPRNKELILISSLAEWLKNTPPPATKGEQESGPILHIVNG